MRRTLLSLAALAAVATPALAQVVESEPNNTPAFATPLGSFTGADAVIATGFITPGDIAMDLPGDVDFYSFTIDFEAHFFATLFGLGDPDADGQLALLDGVSILAADDNSGLDNFPALQLTLSPGTYFLAVTGANDLGFPGGTSFPDGREPDQTPHTEDFAYKLMVGFSVVPAPSAAALLGLGGLAAARRRRR
jgi:hypothetical protein